MANVVAGSYSVTAKTVADWSNGAGANDLLTCRLVAGASTLDEAEFSDNGDVSVLTLVGTVTFASASSLQLVCRATANSNVYFSRIVAINVDTVQRDAVNG